MGRTKRKSELLVTRTQAAELIGLSARQFDDAIRGRIGDGGRNGTGAKLRYVGSSVVAAFVEYRIEHDTVPPGSDPEGLLAAGGNSPNLERLRRFTADLRERDVKERDQHLVRRDVILNAMGPALAGMRGAGDRLIRQYGNDAGEIYNEAVDDFISALERFITATVPPKSEN